MAVAGDQFGEAAAFSAADQEAFRAHLEKVVSSSAFVSSARGSELLRYLCVAALDAAEVNEYAIGVDVFERSSSFDPRLDSIVRTEASRLRKRLRDFYSGEGALEPVRIDLPLRSYVPVFHRRESEAAASGLTVHEVPPHQKRSSFALLSVGVAVLLAVGGFFAWRSLRRAPRPAIATMAVLPFVNLSGDPAKEYVGDSIAEELTEALSESGEVRVVARTSSFQFKNKNDDIREIGRKLNAGAVLEGSIQTRDGHLRVIAQLIQTSDGYHLWSHIYDEGPNDLQHIESEIASSSTRVLAGKSTPAPAQTSRVKPEAHDLYLRSIYQLQLRTPESVKESLALARKAVDVDPSYVRPYGAIVRGEATMVSFRLTDPRESAERSRAAWKKALELNPDYSDGHAWAAMDAYVNAWDWPRAEREFKLALAGQGTQAEANSLYGWSLMTRRRFEEARSHIQIAEDLDPQSPGLRTNMAVDWIFERKFAEARRELDGIFKLNPKSLTAIRVTAWIACIENDCAAARAAAQKAAEWFPEIEDPTGSAIVKVICGQPGKARGQLAELEKKSATEFVSPYLIAEGYAALKDADKTMKYLEKSAEAKETTTLYLEVDTLLDPIRGDPRFIALEHRLGLK